VTFYLILLAIAALGSLVYLALFFTQVPGAQEERLGAYEPLPEDIGTWITHAERSAEGFVRQTRVLFDGEPHGPGTLTFQERLRDPDSNEIVSVVPEVVRKRRREGR
jgi:hypothetical protein